MDVLQRFKRLTSVPPCTSKSLRGSRLPLPLFEFVVNRCCCCTGLALMGCGYCDLRTRVTYGMRAKQVTHCMTSAGRFTPATVDDTVELLIARRSIDMGRSREDAEL
jgi:hypothetical protein